MSKSEQPIPNVLFKYRGDSELTEKIIRNQQVWLSTPAQLNDPLECKIAEIPKVWKAKTIRKMEQAQIMGLVAPNLSGELPKQFFSLSERETKQWLKRFKKLTHSRKVKAMRALYSDHGIQLSKPENVFKDMHERLSSIGVFSLSEDRCNELMWAHYGDNHEGLAFGFKSVNGCKMADPRLRYARL